MGWLAPYKYLPDLHSTPDRCDRHNALPFKSTGRVVLQEIGCIEESRPLWSTNNVCGARELVGRLSVLGRSASLSRQGATVDANQIDSE